MILEDYQLRLVAVVALELTTCILLQMAGREEYCVIIIFFLTISFVFCVQFIVFP